MIYSETDWAGLGQFLVGLAAVAAIIFNAFNRKKLNNVNNKVGDMHETVKQIDKAVNNRPVDQPTVSEDIAEVKAVALDAKDSVAKLNQQLAEGLPQLHTHLRANVLKMDDMLETVHKIDAKQEQLGKKVDDNTRKIDNHLGAHQADADERIAREKFLDARHDKEHPKTVEDTDEGG